MLHPATRIQPASLLSTFLSPPTHLKSDVATHITRLGGLIILAHRDSGVETVGGMHDARTLTTIQQTL